MATTSHPFPAVMEEMLRTIDTAMKSTLQVQESVLRGWTGIARAAPLQGLEDRAGALGESLGPVARSTAEECIRLTEACTRNNLALARAAVEIGTPASVGEVQNKAQVLWDRSMETFRANAQATVDASTKILGAWAKLAEVAEPAAPGKSRKGR